MVSRFVVVFCALFAGSVAAQQPAHGEADAAPIKNPIAATAASINSGRAAFQKQCRFCHGADAKGNGPQAPKDSNPPDLTDDTWKHGGTDAAIFTTIQNGLGTDSVMKAYKGRLTAEETWNIVNYLRSLGADSQVP
jgi:mono/diheme cytochrome c family protein